MTQATPDLFDDVRTPESLAELRLRTLERAGQGGLMRALQARGIGTTNQGGFFLATVDKNFCSRHCPVDPERPLLTMPRIRESDVECPICVEKSSFRKVHEPVMKTPAQRMKFLAEAQPGVPDDPIWTVTETGPNYDRRGHGADTQSALTDAGVTPSEPFRITRIRCRSMARVIELAEEKRDVLPWVTGLRLRPDGALAADWHQGRLSPVEQRLLKAQQAEDTAAKRSQRDRAIRDLQREVL